MARTAQEGRTVERLETLDDVEETLTLTRLTTPGEVAALLGLFAEIAREEGWQPGDALATAPERAVHFALLDRGVLVGGLQIVMRAPAGCLPCQGVWPDVVLPGAVAHVTIIGIKAAYRGNIELFWMLCQAMWCFCAEQGITAVVLEATPRMVRLYRRIGLPLQIVGELRTHWGEPCHLTSVDIVVVAGSVVMRARHSALFRRLVFDALQPRRQPAIVEQVSPKVIGISAVSA
jgi:ribosomal protein S18 acetylase RimI-like enzyme